MHALLLLLGSYIGNTAAIVANSYMGKTPKLPMAKGKPARRLSMVPKFSVVNAIEEIIVIIIIIIIIIIIGHKNFRVYENFLVFLKEHPLCIK